MKDEQDDHDDYDSMCAALLAQTPSLKVVNPEVVKDERADPYAEIGMGGGGGGVLVPNRWTIMEQEIYS